MKTITLFLFLIQISSLAGAQSQFEKRIRLASAAEQVDWVFENMDVIQNGDQESSVEIIVNPYLEQSTSAESAESSQPVNDNKRSPAADPDAEPVDGNDFCFQKYFLLALQNPELYEKSMTENVDLVSIDPEFERCAGYIPAH